MNSLLLITLLGLSAGVIGTGLGGLITFFWQQPDDKSVSFLLGLASGVMTAVVMVDLLPQAVNHSNLWSTIGGVFAGLLVLKVLAYYIKTQDNSNQYIETGLLVGVGIALHNFPEGLAIGAGYVATAKLGFGLAVVIALHNFPEGLSMATPMNIGGWSPAKILGATILPGLPMGLGAFCGGMLSYISPLMLALNLAFAGGGMLYITVYELIPQAYSFRYGLLATGGFLCGIAGGTLLVLLL